jgi:cellobiose phosphorylase
LSWQPCPKKLDFYECRHGLGYTNITTQYKGVKGSVTYFIPLQDDLELWRVSLTNTTDKPKQLGVFSYVELCLGHALVDLINQPNDQHFNNVQFHKEDNTLYATKRYWVTYSGPTVKQANKAWNKWVFFSTTLPVAGFDGYKNKFIGRWRSEQDPIAVEEGQCYNTEITAGDAVGALQNDITLAPGETVDFVVTLGVVHKNPEDELPTNDRGQLTPTSFRTRSQELVKKYTNVQNADAELAKLKAWWKDYLNRAQVNTPDPEFNLMMNVWNQYQNKTTFNFSRNASYYHGGFLFGRGYRDSCQDMLGPVMYEPEVVKERILEMGKHQFKNGSVMHCYFPILRFGSRWRAASILRKPEITPC